MKEISGKGWFVLVVSSLVAGNIHKVMEAAACAQEGNMLANWGGNEIRRLCCSLAASGFAHKSRKGWATINHPALGTMQWKNGVDFKTVAPYFFLRINGDLILKAWPRAGSRTTQVIWMAKAARQLQEHERTGVERFLGRI